MSNEAAVEAAIVKNGAIETLQDELRQVEQTRRRVDAELKDYEQQLVYLHRRIAWCDNRTTDIEKALRVLRAAT